MKTEDIGTEFSNIESTPFYKKFGTPLYHASRKDFKGLVKLKKRPAPRDTATIFHNEVNALSKEKHGVEVRSLLFVMKNPFAAYNYASLGSVYYVSPVSEDYQVWYSTNTEDMTNDLRVTDSAIAMNLKAKIRAESMKSLKNYEDYDEHHDLLKVKRIENIAVDHLKDCVRNKTYRIKDCFYEIYKKIEENKFIEDRYKKPTLKAILMQKTHEENLAYDYVLTLKKLESSDELRSLGDDQELMVYDPVGVYAVKYAQE